MTAAALRIETPRRHDVQRPAERLRALAARVARLGVVGRVTPETIVVEKLSLAAEMRRLAAELER